MKLSDLKAHSGEVFSGEKSATGKAAEAKTIECVMRNFYLLTKEEISNRKAQPIKWACSIGVKRSSTSSTEVNECQKKWCPALGDVFCNSFLPDIQAARCFELLVDDLTGIAIQGQMICFNQYLDKKTS